MEIVRTCAELQDVLQPLRRKAQPYAFVPTMGALHEGHLTLVREALQHYPFVVVSIFVNPTQFDRPDDLARYPRQPDQDAALLEKVGTSILFLPSVAEMYPFGFGERRTPDLAGLDTRYEGASRPGHFGGVVQVVRRLVELVRPAAMFMGQKDAQQVAVLRRAAQQEFWPLHIIAIPTVREASGLAMSSRNGLLSAAGFAKAQLIYETLQWAKSAWLGGQTPFDIMGEGKSRLTAADFKPEYFDFVHAASFITVDNAPIHHQPATDALLITVAWLESVRLIDNLYIGLHTN